MPHPGKLRKSYMRPSKPSPWILRASLAAILTLTGAATIAQDSPYRPGPNRYPKFDGKQAEPRITYGTVPGLSTPRTILYSVSPAALVADAESLGKLGFNAFFITGVSADWSTDIWGSDGEPWTIGRSDKNWQAVRKATARCKEFDAETFLTLAFSHPFDWFDDLAWQKIENNFTQFALFAKTSGCTGVAIDIEYIGEQYSFAWKGYDYAGYTRRDLVAQVRKRAAQIARAIFDAFPEARFLTFPEQGYNLGSWLHAEWIEEAARRQAPGGIHLCTEYTYRRPNIRYMFAHAWLNNRVLQSLLSEKGKAYWLSNCSIAQGLWPFGVDPDSGHGAAPTPAEFRQAFAASLMASARYNWVYSHDAYEAMLGRSDRSYPGQPPVSEYLPILRERQMASDADYVRVAQELRRLKLRDYSQDLALALAPAMIGPREELALEIMPKSLYGSSVNAALQGALWDAGLRALKGEPMNTRALFPAQTDWLLIGPFANRDKRGFAAIYPPEQSINLNAELEGMNGKVRWTEYHCPSGSVMVDLARQFKPSEEVCAYGLCFAKTDRSRQVQIRLSGNDTWKLWVGGKLVHESPDEGRIILDREVLPVSLPAGTTPILVKVCNNRRDWGFVLRITDPDGKPVPGLQVGLKPQ
jgi:hypothetical protein